jgi:hypothetical protein
LRDDTIHAPPMTQMALNEEKPTAPGSAKRMPVF